MKEKERGIDGIVVSLWILCYTNLYSQDKEVRKMMKRMMKKEPVKKAKRGVLGVIFSRFFLIVILLVVQIALLIGSLTFLKDYETYVYGLFVVLSIMAVVYLVNTKSNPAFKTSWILFILLIPVVGTAFYIFMMIQPGTHYLAKRLRQLDEAASPYMKQNLEILEDLRVSKPANANLAHYMTHSVSYPVHRNTKVTYFPLGEDKFEEMKLQLQKAEHYIFLEYFIVEEGIMWNTILDILEQKVKEGVEVRFMYDGMCSVIQLPYHYPKKMKQAGIKCKIFSPVRPILSSYQNNRDHRKILVIDGRVAFTGGVNLADEYINKKERFGHWKDTAVMLEGEAVQSFTMMFLQMWNVSERQPENYTKYLTPKAEKFKRELGFVLPYGDSPFDHENIGEQVYFHLLNHAKKYVHIMTPYLILDNEMVTNLTYTAKCGIEVIIIMPYIPDKWYAFAVAKTYYEELIEAGVQIYEYTPGFVHAKVFVSDNDTATVGTINLDYRSLYHHFECGTFIYNNPVVWEVEKDFQATLKKCQKVTVEALHSCSLQMKLVGRVLRLIAPLM